MAEKETKTITVEFLEQARVISEWTSRGWKLESSYVAEKPATLRSAGYQHAVLHFERDDPSIAERAVEQKEKEAFRQRYNETTGKDISLSDVVKDNGEWAYEGDVKAAKVAAEQKEKEAFRQRYNETNGKDISLADVVKDSKGKWAYVGDVKADAIAAAKAEQRKKRNSIIIAAISCVVGSILLYIGTTTNDAWPMLFGAGIICGGISGSIGFGAGIGAVIGAVIGGIILAIFGVIGGSTIISGAIGGAIIGAITGAIGGVIALAIARRR